MRYLDVLLADRPLGVWPLEELSGTVARGYGSLGNATYSASGVSFGQYGPGAEASRSVATDGAAGVVTLPALTGFLGTAQPQTWEYLLRLSADVTSASAANVSWGSDSPGTLPIVFGASTGNLTNEVVSVFNAAGGASDVTGWTGITVPAGWHHHAITYDGTQNSWTYYLDGAAVGTRVSFSGGSFGMLGSLTYTIARSAGTTYYTQDGVAYPAIYDRRLSEGEITRHARSALLALSSRNKRLRAA